VNKVTPVSLGYPLSVFNKNSTQKKQLSKERKTKVYPYMDEDRRGGLKQNLRSASTGRAASHVAASRHSQSARAHGGICSRFFLNNFFKSNTIVKSVHNLPLGTA